MPPLLLSREGFGVAAIVGIQRPEGVIPSDMGSRIRYYSFTGGGTTASVYVVQWIEATQVSGTHPVRSRLPTLARFTPALFVPRF